MGEISRPVENGIRFSGWENGNRAVHYGFRALLAWEWCYRFTKRKINSRIPFSENSDHLCYCTASYCCARPFHVRIVPTACLSAMLSIWKRFAMAFAELWIFIFWSIAAHSITLNWSWAKFLCRNDIRPFPCESRKRARERSPNAKWMRWTFEVRKTLRQNGMHLPTVYSRTNKNWNSWLMMSDGRQAMKVVSNQKNENENKQKIVFSVSSYSCTKTLAFEYSHARLLAS